MNRLARRPLSVALAAGALALALASAALAALPSQPASAGSAAVPAPAGAQTCVERLPLGKQRPTVSESFPDRGTSGHVAELEVVVEHGKGENVLPGGFRLESESEGSRELERAGFVLPDPDGGAGPLVAVEELGERSKTTVRIRFVPLPPKPGRHELELPPVPLAIARASGDLLTICTKPHRILVEDPIANVPNPEPRYNPAPRRQLEEWTLAKQVASVAAVALVVGALVAWLLGRWLRRPKPAPPPPPPRPPWEIALEELFDIKNAGLFRAERYAEHFDRVSDAVRKYLGDRYGFDGLESTTRETLGTLRGYTPRIAVLDTIEEFLLHADLVKFARLTPSEADCEQALSRGEEIVRTTIPAMLPVQAPRLPGVTQERDESRAAQSSEAPPPEGGAP